MTRTIIDVHALQTVPPSNLNRDDTGSPKTAVYGGKTRARVSSQAWKRAIRKHFREETDSIDNGDLGRRTLEIVDTLAERITKLDSSLAENAVSLANEAFKAAGIATKVKTKKGQDPKPPVSDYLIFLSNRQYDKLAEAIVAGEQSGDKPTKKALKDIIKDDHSIDIALFGRMVADMPDVNVDASCQVAHALSVHEVANEFDYYTAVDDTKEDAAETGAGMIGTLEFNSSTLYRYATVDVDLLRDNLGDDVATTRAVVAFVESFAKSMPSGKKNSFANGTLPDTLVVSIRDSQAINYVGAFERPVKDGELSRLDQATKTMGRYAEKLAESYDMHPQASWYLHTGDVEGAKAFGEKLSLPQLLGRLEEAVSQRVGQE